MGESEKDYFQWYSMRGQETMAANWNAGIPFKHREKVFLCVGFVLFFFFTVRVVKHWNGLLGEAVGSSSLNILKTQLDMVLSNLF